MAIIVPKMKKFPFFVVDAFTTGENESFTGSPASICLLNFDDEIGDEVQLKIGKETNHANTAFVSGGWSRGQCLNSTEARNWTIRWVTPEQEVDLCGHATLGAAQIIFNKILRHREIYENRTSITFETQSRGKLGATMDWETGITTLNFPSSPPSPLGRKEYPWLEELIRSTLGPSVSPKAVDDVELSQAVRFLILRLKVPEGTQPEALLKKVRPDVVKMVELVPEAVRLLGVCVTVQGLAGAQGPHFYSRVFSPWIAINEDPACGSLHTVLGPYWGKHLGMEGKRMLARMCAVRGADLTVTLLGDRVDIGGKARLVVEGELTP